MHHEQTAKILLLEDDDDDRRLVTKQLRSQCYRFVIDEAETLAAALEKLGRNSYDIVVSDLSVTDSIGCDTIARLRQRCGKVPIIALTSLDDESVERDILAAGAQDYLVKGECTARTVVRAILHAIQRQQAMNGMNALVLELEQSRNLLQNNARLLRGKNHRLRQLNNTAQEFVDNVSHDFRTPLTVIKDYVMIISEGLMGEVNDEQQKMLGKVSVCADDLNNMVDDLLDVSKLETGLFGACRRRSSVVKIISRAETMLKQRADVKGVELIIECDVDLPLVYCDAEKAGRVITNLTVNAIKFAGENGRVRLWAKADLPGNQVVIGVTDTGPGIDKESLDQIFERFQQLDSHGIATVKGFGLGLNIAQKLCKLNLGELSVQSRVGDGSTFSFTLPFANPPDVLLRWLKEHNHPDDSLRVVEIAVGDEATTTAADEFDSFLNSLLRLNDLLFRLESRRWALVMSVAQSEACCWFKRAEKEYAKTNRNRPLGPLPEYSAETYCEWSSTAAHDVILSDFVALVTSSGHLVSVS